MKTRNTIGQQIKAELKKHFPNVKFSVNYKSYSGGCSVSVNYTDSIITSEQVSSAICQYKAGYFDSNQDCYIYNNSTISETVDYIFVNKNYSENVEKLALENLNKKWGKSYTSAGHIEYEFLHAWAKEKEATCWVLN